MTLFLCPYWYFRQVLQIPLCAYYILWAFFSCKTFFSIQHYFYKTNIFHISWSFDSYFFIVLSLQQMYERIVLSLKRYFDFDELQLKDFYAIALKFSAKQINWIRKKSVSAIYKIMSIHVDFRIFEDASIAYFKKNTKTQIELKPNIFWKIADTLLSRMLWSWHVPKFREKYISAWRSWSSWKFFSGLKTTWILGQCILWILDILINPRFNKWFKGQRNRRPSNFCQIS